jgi:hypothetical protein
MITARGRIVIFALCFLYAIAISIFFREHFIPQFMQSVDGHLSGDPYYYYGLAIDKLDAYKSNGISAFELHLKGQGPAGVASILLWLWNNIYSVIVLNAVLHALSVIAIIHFLQSWFSLKTSILASMPLLTSPYMMIWYSEINKETYTLISAVILINYLTVLMSGKKQSLAAISFILGLIVLSGVFAYIGRPYVNQILFPWLVLGALCYTLQIARKSEISTSYMHIALLVPTLICFWALGSGGASGDTIDNFGRVEDIAKSEAQVANPTQEQCLRRTSDDRWIYEPLVPDSLERKLKTIARVRCNTFYLLDTNINQRTRLAIVDEEIFFGSTRDILAYLPRAFYWGVFAPGPESWPHAFSEGLSPFFLFASIESILFAGGLLVILVWVITAKKWLVLFPLVICLSTMNVFGMAIPFLGALYRYRYPWRILLICMAVAILTQYIANRTRPKNRFGA